MSMMGHRVVVHDWMTIRLNLAAMSPYNADCDGDTIIIHVPQKATTRTEVREIMDVSHQTLTPQSNKPVMGLIQDTVWAWKQATLRDVLMLDEDFYRYASKSQMPHWMRHVGRPAVMVRKAAILSDAAKEDEYSDDDSDGDVGQVTATKDAYVALRTGKQLFSTVLPLGFHLAIGDTRFQFDTTRSAPTTHKKEEQKQDPATDAEDALAARIAKAEVWLKDMDIAIVDHELIRGSIDTSITGKSSGGIAHHMALENTPEEMQAFFSSAQKVVSPWTADEGLSTGPSDLTLSPANRRKISGKMRHTHNIPQRQASEAQLEKLEQKLCVALNDITTHLGEDAMDMAGPTNRMVQMISLAKSKGDKVGGTCASRSHRVRRFAPCASPFPPFTPQDVLLAARAALEKQREGEGKERENVQCVILLSCCLCLLFFSSSTSHRWWLALVSRLCLVSALPRKIALRHTILTVPNTLRLYLPASQRGMRKRKRRMRS
jgi:hypothetical protein